MPSDQFSPPGTAVATARAWASLNILTKRRYDALISHFGSLDAAWEHLDADLLRKLGCKKETIERVLTEKESLKPNPSTPQPSASSLRASPNPNPNYTFLTIEDNTYPAALRNIPDPPPFLFARGDCSILEKPCIGIVGTRAMSNYGKRATEHIVEALVHAGCTTVSGLAVGVDAEVALRTMEYGGKTTAILGNGIDTVYPRAHAHLAQEIVKKGGLILTEFPPGVKPDTYTFPARNRIIAGLSLATVVVEAASQSGSLITASLALEYGKEVYAVPGQIFDINFAGTHELIARGQAKLLSDPRILLEDLGMVVPDGKRESAYVPQTPEEEILCTVLTAMPQSANDLAEKTELSMSVINATLTLMELKGGVKNVGAGQWIRC